MQKHPLLSQIFLESLENPNRTSLCVFETEAEAQEAARFLKHLCTQTPEVSFSYLPGFMQTGVFKYESAKKVLANRLQCAFHTITHPLNIIVTTSPGLSRQIPGEAWFDKYCIQVKNDAEILVEELEDTLHSFGYSEVDAVEAVGEFAVRGSILDVWSPANEFPLRIEFFGDTVEAIRWFRPSDQKSFTHHTEAYILPCREFVWPADDALPEAVENFNQFLLKEGVTGQERGQRLENLKHSVPFPGVDDIYSTFTDTKGHKNLIDLLKSKGREVVLFLGSPQEKLAKSCLDLENFYDNAHRVGRDKGHISPQYSLTFPDGHRISQLLADISQSELPQSSELSRFELPKRIAQYFTDKDTRKITQKIQFLKHALTALDCQSILLCVRNLSTAAECVGFLGKTFPKTSLPESESGIPPLNLKNLVTQNNIGCDIGEKLRLARADILFSPMYCSKDQTLIVSELWLRGSSADTQAVVGEERTAQDSRAATIALMSKQFGEFNEGDLVVHVQHGIAQFKGLVTIQVADTEGDFLLLEYAGNDRIYVPVHKMTLVQKYVGSHAEDALNKLDSLKGTAWKKKREKAREDAEKVAQELLVHQAKRAVAQGHIYQDIGEDYLEFESSFPYDETEDQIKATSDIMKDMSHPQPMDRLLCGDVGFGKTEVAMRAACRALIDGKQVAWLVPTTVLAHQHFRSLEERFAHMAVNTVLLDRSSGAKSKKDLEALKAGRVDMVVGTHRLLSKDVVFKDLGLLIVDEEQRFGVLQKEKIKQLSYRTDVLTMTATPIPRTMQMAMVGLKDLSLLATPPRSRLAVKTFVCPFDEDLVKEAIEKEIQRGGQVFYVHNRVEELETVRKWLVKLVPHVKMCTGHGKMGQKELDAVMVDFIDQQYSLMLCTTIIESGIDMPNVNTIIVQNADHFGLSQLYQLRGRVGRRSTRSFAYFLKSPKAKPKDEGSKRLDILQQHQDLGSGFAVASHDLEMRGAGNILGDAQSGKMNDVGVETYMHMLDKAIKQLSGRKVEKEYNVDINLPIVYKVSEKWVTDQRQRLSLYRRFFSVKTEEQLSDLKMECEDRFGPMPEQTENLVQVARMRRLCRNIGAISLGATSAHTEIKLSPDVLQPSGEDQQALVTRILDVCNRMTKDVRLTPDGRVLLLLPAKSYKKSPEAAFQKLGNLLGLLSGEMSQASS